MDAIIPTVPKLPGFRWRHIELTIKSSDDPRLQCKQLLAAFRKLRQRPWWSRYVKGGFFVVEFTHGTAGWHGHLHILVYSRFIYQSTLSEQWQKCGGGPVVWIKLAPTGTLVRYLTSYLTKAEMTEAFQRQASVALKNLRLFNAFGSINPKGISILKERFKCPSCNGSNWIHERSKAYVEALAIAEWTWVSTVTLVEIQQQKKRWLEEAPP